MAPVRQLLDIDDILPATGEFGRFQIILETCLCLCVIPASFQALIVYFAAYNPPWRCVSTGPQTNSTVNNTACTLKGTYSSESTLYEARCKMPRSAWEYTEPTEYSIVTQVSRRV